MERLTTKSILGGWTLKVQRQEAVDRLAAYEDTGLEPEEIPTGLELANTYAAMLLLKRYQALGPVETLSALVKAQNEGRVVVLQGDYAEADGEEALRTAMYHCGVTNNPVTRYTADAIAEKLVRDEAETTLLIKP